MILGQPLNGCEYSEESTSIANLSRGPSRCFPFWQELLACYVVNTDTGDLSGGRKCLPALEDYYECLHHRKEVRQPHFASPAPHWACRDNVLMGYSPNQAARTRALQHAYRRAEAATPRENAPKAGTIRNLGLLGKEEDTKKVIAATSK